MAEKTALEANYAGVFDGRIGFGIKPALLSVDFMNAYTTKGAPLYAPGVVAAVEESVELYRAAREAQVPVIYSRVQFHRRGIDGGMFVRKVPALRQLVEGEPLGEIVPELAPGCDDLVIVKQYASAFFGTSLAATLTALGIDTLILTGCSTSGCIRATAIDGIQHGYRVIVPRECVGDRQPGPHEANLFDINAKYGDVVGKSEVVDYFSSVRAACAGSARSGHKEQ